jgi:hypothetical protein
MRFAECTYRPPQLKIRSTLPLTSNGLILFFLFLPGMVGNAVWVIAANTSHPIPCSQVYLSISSKPFPSKTLKSKDSPLSFKIYPKRHIPQRIALCKES